MAQTIVNVPPLDPNLYTGPWRLLAAPARTGNVTLNTPYGPNGSVEFASRLWCGTAGDVSYVKWDGTTQVLHSAQAGIWHHIYSIQINSSGTAATELVWGS